MSMHHATSGPSDPGGTYVVVPPRVGDVLSRALRDAYRPIDTNAFDDLLRDLDRTEIPPRHN